MKTNAVWVMFIATVALVRPAHAQLVSGNLKTVVMYGGVSANVSRFHFAILGIESKTPPLWSLGQDGRMLPLNNSPSGVRWRTAGFTLPTHPRAVTFLETSHDPADEFTFVDEEPGSEGVGAGDDQTATFTQASAMAQVISSPDKFFDESDNDFSPALREQLVITPSRAGDGNLLLSEILVNEIFTYGIAGVAALMFGIWVIRRRHMMAL